MNILYLAEGAKLESTALYNRRNFLGLTGTENN